MDKISVLIASRLDLPAAYVKEMAAVDPRFAVKDGSGLFLPELRRTGRQGLWVDQLEQTVAAAN